MAPTPAVRRGAGDTLFGDGASGGGGEVWGSVGQGGAPPHSLPPTRCATLQRSMCAAGQSY